jgi:hypothetical protein
MLLVLLFCSAGSAALAQSRDSLVKLYDNQTLSRSGSFFQKGGQRLLFRDLQNEFSFSTVGQYHYTEAKKHRTTATVFRLFSLAATVASFSFLSRENNRATIYTTAGQIGLNIAGFYFQNRSNQHLDRAIWLRNRDLLFGQ